MKEEVISLALKQSGMEKSLPELNKENFKPIALHDLCRRSYYRKRGRYYKTLQVDLQV